MSEEFRSILPNDVSLKIQFIDEENVDFEYIETFKTDQSDVVDRSVETMRPICKAVGISVERPQPHVVRLSGTVPSKRIGNMMVTEFLCWSDLGELRFRDLFIGATMGAINASRAGMDERHEEMLDDLVTSENEP